MQCLIQHTFDNLHSVTSNAVAQKIGLMGKQALIYNGDTYDGTTKNFTSSIKNFRYLYIQLATNLNYDYILLPTDNIDTGTSVMRTAMMGYSQGQVALPFPYQSTAEITILSDTTFKCISYYNNVNWILKVRAIWGVC